MNLWYSRLSIIVGCLLWCGGAWADSPLLVAEPASIMFDGVAACSHSTPACITLTNKSGGPLTIRDAYVTAHPHVFDIKDMPLLGELPNDSSTTLTVIFHPGNAGESYSGQVEVRNECDVKVASVTLSGTARKARQTDGTDSGETQVTAGATAASQSGTGASGGGTLIGVRQVDPNQVLSGVFNFTQPGTVTGSKEQADDFGAALLSPSTEARSVGFSWGGVGNPTSKCRGVRFGFYGRLGATLCNWEFKPDDVAQSDGASGPLAFGALGVQAISARQPVSDEQGATHPYGVGVQVGWTFRSLLGNLRQKDELRTKMFDSTRTFFQGLEMTLFLDLGDIKPFARYLSFSYADQIPSFTGGQIIFGVEAQTPLFRSGGKAAESRGQPSTEPTPKPEPQNVYQLSM